MNSSPTLDSERRVAMCSRHSPNSRFPLHRNARCTDCSALRGFLGRRRHDGRQGRGWAGARVEPLLIRGSWSEAYRVPNLVTINESGVARSNTVDDRVCEYAASSSIRTGDVWIALIVCSAPLVAVRTSWLKSPRIRPSALSGMSRITLTVTLDFWAIEKEKTIGLFGEENHTALELLNLLEAGTATVRRQADRAWVIQLVIRDDPWDPALGRSSAIRAGRDLQHRRSGPRQ